MMHPESRCSVVQHQDLLGLWILVEWSANHRSEAQETYPAAVLRWTCFFGGFRETRCLAPERHLVAISDGVSGSAFVGECVHGCVQW